MFNQTLISSVKGACWTSNSPPNMEEATLTLILKFQLGHTWVQRKKKVEMTPNYNFVLKKI